jgi:putative tricarboxylic transport membrane protein
VQNLSATLLGAILGLVVGATPGIGSLAGVALLLPLTYRFNPITAIISWGPCTMRKCMGARSARSC